VGGFDKTRLTAIGYGESRPVASNETAVGRNTNRRIEVLIINE
jgi:flagellar motor protein MotB